MVLFVVSVRPRLEIKCRELWADVREDERYSHSAWLKSAVITAFILTVYFGVLITSAVRDFLYGTYEPRRKCLTDNKTYAELFLALTGFAKSTYSIKPGTDIAEIERQLSIWLDNPQDPIYKMHHCDEGMMIFDPRLVMVNAVESMKNKFY